MPQKLWNKNFVLMLQGGFVSGLGDVLYSLAIGYYVYTLTGSEAMLGLFSSLTMFVNMGLGPVAGAMADRISRKGLLVAADAARGILMLFLGVLCLRGAPGVPTLVLLTAVIAVAGAFFEPCVGTVILDIVPKHELVRAQSLQSAASSTVKLLGKGISGFLLAFAGVGWLIVFNGLSFLCSAFTECFIAVPRTAQQGPLRVATMAKDLKDGCLALCTTKGLNCMFFSSFFINLFGAGVFSLLLIFTQQNGFSVQQYGILSAMLSAGSLAGAAFVSCVKLSGTQRATAFAGGFLLSTLCFCAAFLSRNFILICVLTLAGAIFNMLGNTLLNAGMMLALPQQNRAAILGFANTSSIGGTALSVVLYGALAEWIPMGPLAATGMLLSLVPFLALVGSAEVRGVIRGTKV